MTSSTSSDAGDGESGGADALQPLPVEARAVRGWLRACVRTLARTLTRPSQSFRRAPEPIAHGRVLGYLATLRLPAWGLLVAIEASRIIGDPTRPMPLRSIHNLLDAPLVQALTSWLVLMVPVGLPLLYFFGGLLAHLGIALTGGASRSIGASMRAIGYAAGPALLVIGVLDLPLYLGEMSAVTYLVAVIVAALLLMLLGGIGLARTHQMSVVRGWAVALLPAVLLAGVTAGRAALVLRELPGMPVPDQPYYVP
ncbi:MAG: hypothetical protein IAG13_14800 [Deltaproteobacteria bacterium]|nr:hypothetical protein [Nannocystaceae bacterium]